MPSPSEAHSESMPPIAQTSAAPSVRANATTARRDAAIQHFTTSRSDGAFTGGDGTYSIPLPDGRSAWIFGDSFKGGVHADGTRGADEVGHPGHGTFVRNALVLQDDADFRMVTGRGDAGELVSAARPIGAAENRDGSGGDDWYWPGHGVADGSDRVRVFMQRFRTPPGESHLTGWNWEHRGTDLVTFESRTGAREGTVELTGPASGVLWGAAVLERGEHAYLYGAKDRNVHLARAPRTTLDDVATWQAWDGARWNGDLTTSAALGPRVSNQFSVVDAKDGGVLLVSQDGFEPAVRAWHAPTPEGPMTGGGIVARIPDQPGERHTYNAVAHPQFTAPDTGDLLVSYNVSGADFMTDHTSYRPGFLTVPGAALPGGGAAGVPPS